MFICCSIHNLRYIFQLSISTMSRPPHFLFSFSYDLGLRFYMPNQELVTGFWVKSVWEIGENFEKSWNLYKVLWYELGDKWKLSCGLFFLFIFFLWPKFGFLHAKSRISNWVLGENYFRNSWKELKLMNAEFKFKFLHANYGISNWVEFPHLQFVWHREGNKVIVFFISLLLTVWSSMLRLDFMSLK